MPTDRFTFPGHAGHDLAARLDLPEGPHLATAMLAHCFTCGKDIAASRRIADTDAPRPATATARGEEVTAGHHQVIAESASRQHGARAVDDVALGDRGQADAHATAPERHS